MTEEQVKAYEVISTAINNFREKLPGEFVMVDGCAFRWGDIQCILNTEGEYPYEVYFRGGHTVMVDEETGSMLLGLL